MLSSDRENGHVLSSHKTYDCQGIWGREDVNSVISACCWKVDVALRQQYQSEIDQCVRRLVYVNINPLE